jgi:hypothetical protein
MGFEATNLATLKLPAGMSGADVLFDEFLDRIDRYKATRDFPATKGPSYLSVHLRFGTISIRRLAREAHARGGAGAEGVAERTDLAGLLLPDPLAQPARAQRQLPAGIRCRALGGRRGEVPRVVRRVAPDIRWSMPHSASWRRPGTCTTGCAWSAPPS